MRPPSGPAGGDTSRALAAGIASAGRAPSIHNTQPWRWRIHDGVADLHTDVRRQLHVTDPDGRLMTVSCGAALHHACVALAALGMSTHVERLPRAGDPGHLARVSITDHMPATDHDRLMAEMMTRRHTDRRPLLDEPLPHGTLPLFGATVAAYGIGLAVLTVGQVLKLADATYRAQCKILTDPVVRTELAAWTSDLRPAFAGVPMENIPNRAQHSPVPGRDFGHSGDLGTFGGHDAAATYAILHGEDDSPAVWLRAGEALSALWLVATERDVNVLPLSAPIETPETRADLRGMLGAAAFPMLALRLGLPKSNQPAIPLTPRFPSTAVIEIT